MKLTGLKIFPLLTSLMINLSLRGGTQPPDSSAAPAGVQPVGFDFGWMILKTALTLGLIIGLIFGTVYLLKKFWGHKLPGTANKEFFRILYKLPINPKQSIALIKVLDRVLLVGISESAISLLTEFENSPEVQRFMNEISQGASNLRDGPFRNILKKQMEN